MSSELESDVCYRVFRWRHLVKAMDVTAGMDRRPAESDICDCLVCRIVASINHLLVCIFAD